MGPRRARSVQWVVLAGLLALSLPLAAFAQEPPPAAPEPARSKKLDWETGEGHSYFIPAFEIGAFIGALNAINRTISETNDYDTDWNSIKKNFTTHEVIDHDPFSVNQIGHPYQ